jgi:hypothetical protein
VRDASFRFDNTTCISYPILSVLDIEKAVFNDIIVHHVTVL